MYYHVVVEVKGDISWIKIINDEKAQDFFIESNSEMAIVKTSTIQKNMRRLFLVKDFKYNSGFRNDAPGKLEAYLKQHNKNKYWSFGY